MFSLRLFVLPLCGISYYLCYHPIFPKTRCNRILRELKVARSALGPRRGLIITHKKLVNAPAVVLRVRTTSEIREHVREELPWVCIILNDYVGYYIKDTSTSTLRAAWYTVYITLYDHVGYRRRQNPIEENCLYDVAVEFYLLVT